ncbi:MAG: RNA-binding transcriptional accessory protein [Candidatus Lokiarchaeota archaeon]|nr:RNA-binding transcriptional accessory protein [Candidatus Lokiarchaeota archaeon]
MSIIIKMLAEKFGRSVDVINNTMALFKEGNTIPFISRYRKEITRELDEVQLRDLQSEHTSLVNREERRATILASVQEQGKLTPELERKIRAAETLTELEDLYLPYKPRRLTKAQKAREAGLEPLAEIVRVEQPAEGDKVAMLQQFVNADKGVNNEKDALDGAMEIIAENLSEDAEIRKSLRDIVDLDSELQCKAIDAPTDTEVNEDGSDATTRAEDEPATSHVKTSKDKYKDYLSFKLKLRMLKPHQILAINRGENEGFLDVELATNDAEFIAALKADIIKNQAGIFKDELDRAIEHGYSRVARTIKRESWVQKIEDAKSHGVKVFAENVKKLLLQQPLKGRRIVGVDPGYRNGCKVAVIDETGKFLDKVTVYPHPPQNRAEDAKAALLGLARRHKAFTFAIGNGTASRETEALVAELVQQEPSIEYTIVSEAGASVYSASDIAREEFPDLDVNIRSAVSIARRLQDPLPELIKIDPKSIGVGLYQHDVNQTELGQKLEGVVEDCVNTVGVNVNNASAELLRQVSGLNSRVAKEIVARREAEGQFKNREQIKEVKFMGTKTYEQSIGFLKVLDGDNPLDSTFIHPESYDVAVKILDAIGARPADLRDPAKATEINRKLSDPTVIRRFSALAGEATLADIIDALKKPRRDPRDDLPPVILKKDVLNAEDLRVGMVLKGTVRNVLDFGAFVDIGIKYNGLVHISELSNTFVKNPHDVISVGDVVDVMVKEIDLSRKRVQLSIKATMLPAAGQGSGGPQREGQGRPERPGRMEGQGRPAMATSPYNPGMQFKNRQQRRRDDRPLVNPGITFKQKQSKRKDEPEADAGKSDERAGKG